MGDGGPDPDRQEDILNAPEIRPPKKHDNEQRRDPGAERYGNAEQGERRADAGEFRDRISEIGQQHGEDRKGRASNPESLSEQTAKALSGRKAEAGRRPPGGGPGDPAG